MTVPFEHEIVVHRLHGPNKFCKPVLGRVKLADNSTTLLKATLG